MRTTRALLIGFSTACILIPCSFGQTVVKIGDPAKELKRTAHQLRISVDQLRNARTALKEATILAQRSTDSSVFSQIAQSWIRIDRSKAVEALEDLYAWRRTMAQGATDIPTFQNCRMSAQTLLRSLATLNSERAVALWRQWPDPPPSLGEAFRKSMSDSDAMFAKQLASVGSATGLGPDITMLSEAAARGEYSSTGMLAMQLSQSGERAEALKLVDQAIADFRQREPDQRSLTSYLSFVRQLPNVDPGRFLQALDTLMPALAKQGNPNTGGTVTVGDQTVQITGAEAAVIDLCRAMTGRPDLAMKTLNTIPGLKSKLEPVGGIDSITSPPRGTQQTVSLSYSVDGLSRTTYNAGGSSSSMMTTSVNAPAGSPGSAAAVSMDLYQSVRGKLAKNPELVRQKLAEVSKDPNQIDALIMLASRSSYQEPDLASMALEAASQLMMQVEPLSRRASVLQNLRRTYQSCEGEVDSDLLQKGLTLVQQLRDEEKNRPMPNLPARGPVGARITSMADQLEMTIMADFALDDFNATMSYLRMLPEPMKLQALMRIVTALTQGY